MVDCNNCIFSKCCKDVDRNLRKCEYYEEHTTWIKDYLQLKNLWQDDRNDEIYTDNFDYTDNFLSYVLGVRQKENVKVAKEELMHVFRIIGIAILFIITVIALYCGNAYTWSTIYLQLLACIGSSILLFLLGKGLWTFFKYIFGLFKIIARGR